MNALLVIAIMFAIIFIVKTVDNKAVLITTLAVIAGGTLFFAFAGAAAGSMGGLFAVIGFVAAGVITYLVKRGGKK